MKHKSIWSLAILSIFIGCSFIVLAQDPDPLGATENRVLEKFGEAEEVFVPAESLDWAGEGRVAAPIASAKQTGTILSSAEINRVLDVVLNTSVPIGQGCPGGSFVSGYDIEGGIICMDNTLVSTGLEANESFQEEVREVLLNRGSEVVLDVFAAQNYQSEALSSGKLDGDSLSANEFNRILKVLAENLKLLGRVCPDGKALASINVDGSFNCGTFYGTTDRVEFDNRSVVESKFTGAGGDFEYFDQYQDYLASDASLAGLEVGGLQDLLILANEELVVLGEELATAVSELGTSVGEFNTASNALIAAEAELLSAEQVLASAIEDVTNADPIDVDRLQAVVDVLIPLRDEKIVIRDDAIVVREETELSVTEKTEERDEKTAEREELISRISRIEASITATERELLEEVGTEVVAVEGGGVVTSIDSGKLAGDSIPSTEFNRLLELVIISENMLDSSCPVGELVRGFDNDGNLICGYRAPEIVCDTNYVDVEEVQEYSCSSDETCSRIVTTRLYGLVENRRTVYYTCSGNETCSRVEIDRVAAPPNCTCVNYCS